MRATEVFVPGSFPTHTYVERVSEGLEQTLQDAIDTPGVVVSLSGPSKSGKTVLVEQVVGREQLIAISGAGLETPEDIWTRALDWMEVPHSTTTGRTFGGSLGLSASASGELSVPLVAKGQAGAEGRGEVTAARDSGETLTRRGLAQVVDEIANSEFVLLIDDFHYMLRTIQVEVAKALKEAVRLGVKIVTAAVSHRGDDVVRANPELRGRVRAVDLRYWQEPELTRIASVGFEALNVALPEQLIRLLVKESAGSPQLMQLVCLQSCFVLGIRERSDQPKSIEVSDDTRRAILEQASANTDFRSLVDVLDAGPKTRGTERKTYAFVDDTRGDVYRSVLKAIAADPPHLSLKYDELMDRISKVCVGEAPVGSSVTGTCLQMAKLAQEKFPSERVIDWDEERQILDIPDPYLLFYLRWSERLREE